MEILLVIEIYIMAQKYTKYETWLLLGLDAVKSNIGHWEHEEIFSRKCKSWSLEEESLKVWYVCVKEKSNFEN